MKARCTLVQAHARRRDKIGAERGAIGRFCFRSWRFIFCSSSISIDLFISLLVCCSTLRSCLESSFSFAVLHQPIGLALETFLLCQPRHVAQYSEAAIPVSLNEDAQIRRPDRAPIPAANLQRLPPTSIPTFEPTPPRSTRPYRSELDI